MKTKQLLSVSFAFIFGSQVFAQTSGGPDTYGYTWKNQLAAGGPTYNWVDIKGTGTQITGLGDDNQKGPFNLNWNFRYYWSDYNKVWIGSNGWIGFQNIGNIAAPFPTIPASTAPNNYIAPLTCDLTFTQTNSSPVPGASAWYWTNNQDTFIVQYDSIPYWVSAGSGYSGRYTFQVILSGADSSITYNYKLCQTGSTAYAMASEGLVTGIENSTGQIGLMVLNDVFPNDTASVKFYYPNPVTYQVFDVTPAWNQNSTNGGFFVSAPFSNPDTLKTDLANAGNQSVGSFNVTGSVLDPTFTSIWTSNASCAGLAAGADTVVAYPTLFSTNAPGTYIYRSITTFATDMNSGNDITDVEMVVVDTTLATVGLSYVTATAPATASSWGGNGGQGIYIEPPFYPATITSVEYFVLNSGVTGYHLTNINDDDGAFNSPGTLLFTDSIAAAATIANQWNQKTLATPLVVTSGGVYVSWYENGDTLSALGTDDQPPFSNRNYEIIGGSWATYRNNSLDDIMIKVNIDGTNTTSAENINENTFSLSQNYPNPSSSYTAINFNLVKEGNTQLVIRNMVGQELENINLGNQSAGNHMVKLNTGKLASGIYFYSLKVGDKEITKKMIVSR